MSLRKKTTMTQEKISANRANGRRSHGPVTPEGRERIRAANTRHGFYSQAEAVALACLGEDPAELERLRQDLHDDTRASAALRKELAEHLAEVVWRWKRAGCSQEGFALRLAKDANLTRADRVHAQTMRLKITEERLKRLAQSVAREGYVATPDDLEKAKNLHQEGVLKDMGEIVLALFYELRAPGASEDGISHNEQQRRVLIRIKEIFGLNSDHPPGVKVALASIPPEGSQQNAGATQADVAPDFSPAPADLKVGATQPMAKDEPENLSPEEEARERGRQLLENILTRQVESCEAQRKAILKESLAGPSPYERAAEIALAHPNVALMQRMEESSFHQIWRITNLLLKIERQARQAETQ